MQVFTIDNAYNEKFPVNSHLKNRLKNTDEGVKEMSSVIEKFYENELNEARIEGENIFFVQNTLWKKNRTEDAKRATEDESFRRKLLNEMFPQEANS